MGKNGLWPNQWLITVEMMENKNVYWDIRWNGRKQLFSLISNPILTSEDVMIHKGKQKKIVINFQKGFILRIFLLGWKAARVQR